MLKLAVVRSFDFYLIVRTLDTLKLLFKAADTADIS